MKTLYTGLAITFFIFSTKVIFSSDYYWIGGSGNWSDITHWATTSGGSVTHAQIPTSEDNVFFDANSFSADGQVVTLNNENLFCKDLIASNSPFNVIVRGNNTVKFNSYGSIIISDKVSWEFEGDVRLLSNRTGNLLNLGNYNFCRDLTINGTGEWKLQSPLHVDRLMEIHSGNLITQSNKIKTKFFNIKSSSAEKNLNLKNSIIEIWGESKYSYRPSIDTNYFEIDIRNLNIDKSNFRFFFTSKNVDIRFNGNGDNNFGNFVFSDPEAQILIRPLYTTPLSDDIIFDSLVFMGNATINTPIQANNLSLNKNKVYNLVSGEEFTFQNIHAEGTCTEAIVISATDVGREAYVKSDNTIELDFVTLRDIHGINGVFSVNSGVNLGNNANWHFIDSDPIDYYWIGNGGNWNDPAHWSFTSGGSPSGCLPSGKDNVMFDENSFNLPGQAVYVETENLFVNDMIWKGVFTGSELIGERNSNLHIGGSLEFDENMVHSFSGDYYFESMNKGNSITSNTIPFNRSVYFSGASAEWLLQDSINIAFYCYLNSGYLDAQGNLIRLNRFDSRVESARTLDIEGSYFIYQYYNDGMTGHVPSWWVDNDNFTLMADNSTIMSDLDLTFINQSADTLIFNNIDVRETSRFTIEPETTLMCDSLLLSKDVFFDGGCEINYFKLSPGYTCSLSRNNTYNIRELDANGNCEDGSINIISDLGGIAAEVTMEMDLMLNNLFIKDVHLDGLSEVRLSNSADGGNTDGWIFEDTGSRRTLYWVNNSGIWRDQNHWSLASGGPGGACIPTANDDVIVDENSFDRPNQAIISSKVTFVHSLIWNNSYGNPKLATSLNLLGSIYLEEAMSASGSLIFHTKGLDSVFLSGQEVATIQMVGTGTLKFISDIYCNFFYQYNGTTLLDDIKINARDFSMRNRSDAENFSLKSYLNNSDIILGKNGTFGSFHMEENTEIFPGDSRIIFVNESNRLQLYRVNGNFNQILTTSPSGNITLNIFDNVLSSQSIQMQGNAYINGTILSDTLIGTAGKSYTINPRYPVEINSFLKLKGNNCLSIDLKSNTSGQLADINMPPESKMEVDFVQMKDIQASGGASFYAGTRSTNINNSNEGWVFGNPPDYVKVGFLGRDQVLCTSEDTIILDANNFSPNENYIWSDGTTNPTLHVKNPGIFSVLVDFGNNCVIRDTIEILEPAELIVNLPPDTTICDQTSFIIDASIATLDNIKYQWQDGDIIPVRQISSAGKYTLNIEKDGCTASDSFTVAVQPLPIVDLGPKRSLCEGESIQLEVEYPGAKYLWKDNSTSPYLLVNKEGLYWVAASINGCRYSDTVNISLVNKPKINLGRDTTICEGTVLELTIPEEADVKYSWQDGSMNNRFFVQSSGNYILSGDRDGCQNTDTIVVSYQQIPVFDLGEDQILCEGTPFTIDGRNSINNVDYLWNDGSSNPQLNAMSPGLYWLDASINNCSFRDSIAIEYTEVPAPNLGNDTTLCEGISLNLIAQELSNATYLWQDNTSNSSYMVTQPGTYFVAIDNQGCTSSDTIVVSYQQIPVFDLGEDQILCEGTPFTIDGRNSINNVDYLWNDGSSNPQLNAMSPGLYWLDASINNCSFRDSIAIEYTEVPAPNLGNDTTLCEGIALNLTAQELSNATYLWQDNTSNSSYMVTQPGTYFVAIDNQGCTSSDTIVVSYQQIPVFDLGEDQILCEGTPFTINGINSITNVDYLWNDGSSNPQLNAMSPGLYWLDASINNCSFRDSIAIEYTEVPAPNLGNDTTLCEGISLNLIAQELSNATYLWQDNTSNSSYMVTQPGTYFVAIDNQGCTSSDTIVVSYQQIPVFDLGEDQILCEGTPFTIDGRNSITNVDYLWNDGSSNPQLNAMSPGLYWLDASINNCSFRDSIAIEYTEVPAPNLGNDTTLCEGIALNLTAQELSNATYLWQDNTSNSSYMVTQPGTYFVAIDNQGCISSDTIVVSYQQIPVFDLGEHQILCEGTPYTIDGTNSITNVDYLWNDGSSNPQLNAMSPGLYWLDASINNCSFRDSIAIEYTEVPAPNLGNDTTLCEGIALNLTAQELSNATYLWQDNTSNSSYIVTQPGTYFVTVDNQGCSTSDTIFISYNPTPDVKLSENNVKLCEGEEYELIAPLEYNNYKWEDGSMSRNRILDKSGIHWIEVNQKGCTDRDTLTISIIPNPMLELGKDTIICEDENFIIKPTVSNGILTWSDGSRELQYEVNSPGLITATLNDEGCIIEDEIFIDFKTCQSFEAYIPNTFSPNNDGENDHFSPTFPEGVNISSYRLTIYNRWGSIIFTSENINDPWNGYTNNVKAQTGVYIYLIEVSYQDDFESGKELITGDILLVK